MKLENLLNVFKAYCLERDWTFDQYSSEFTLQFILCRFLDYKWGDKINIELV
jgi:hypothetical protein